MIFFTSDEHYGHANIIKYCGRPFKSIEEMDEELIRRHNSVVQKYDMVIHAGDFAMCSEKEAYKYIYRLTGQPLFLRGSHDKWLRKDAPASTLWEGEIEGQYIAICHYAMRVWPRSHYNSWQLYGHSHGKLEPIGKQWDIGVDNNNFTPVSFEQLKAIMLDRPDNFNLVKKFSGSCRKLER
jgi:calcineurin-like phosphoesterase family protein